MHRHFLSKGPLTSLISSVSYFSLGIEAFSGVLSGNGTEFWAPVTACPPNWGYGVRLIRSGYRYDKICKNSLEKCCHELCM